MKEEVGKDCHLIITPQGGSSHVRTWTADASLAHCACSLRPQQMQRTRFLSEQWTFTFRTLRCSNATVPWEKKESELISEGSPVHGTLKTKLSTLCFWLIWPLFFFSLPFTGMLSVILVVGQNGAHSSQPCRQRSGKRYFQELRQARSYLVSIDTNKAQT